MESKLDALKANMEKDLNELKVQAEEKVHAAGDEKALQDAKVFFLGKKGKLTAILRSMKDLSAAERPVIGALANTVRTDVEAVIAAKAAELKAKRLEERIQSETVDITLPARHQKEGHIHPLDKALREIMKSFMRMGYSVEEGPEIEQDYYNFECLNLPKDHPARDMQDTFYLSPEFLLRTQTSAGQIHVMEAKKPPIKIISPGKVFRSDDDATHSPMFTQMEGLVVDKGITLCDLQGMLDRFVQALFGPEVKTRLRPSYFPFTEPSVEVDVSCFECHGKGCPLCKHSGWIEVLGAGVVHRSVLENCGIDPEVYSGFAFGIGIERIAMLKYGINNIGLMFENDLRFLEQFKG